MADPMLEAARAHGKEPEEVDWEERYFDKCSKFADLERSHCLALSDLCFKDAEIDRLKDVILRLEQRCAKVEGHEMAPESTG